MTEPPPSDPQDLLHIELLPRGRARAATRHSRARHEEMAGEIPCRSAVKTTLHCTRVSPGNRTPGNRDWRSELNIAEYTDTQREREGERRRRSTLKSQSISSNHKHLPQGHVHVTALPNDTELKESGPSPSPSFSPSLLNRPDNQSILINRRWKPADRQFVVRAEVD